MGGLFDDAGDVIAATHPAGLLSKAGQNVSGRDDDVDAEDALAAVHPIGGITRAGQELNERVDDDTKKNLLAITHPALGLSRGSEVAAENVDVPEPNEVGQSIGEGINQVVEGASAAAGRGAGSFFSGLARSPAAVAVLAFFVVVALWSLRGPSEVVA